MHMQETPATMQYNPSYKNLIGEILVYDRALTDPEIETVEKYLGQKWGIAISHDDTPPVAGDPPTLTLTPAADSVTTAHLTEQILKYLKPEITSASQATNVFEGQSATLSASAEGKFMNYQWKKDGNVLSNSNTESYNPSSVDGAGTYTRQAKRGSCNSSFVKFRPMLVTKTGVGNKETMVELSSIIFV